MASDLLTVRETASILRVSPLTVRRYVANGKLAAVRIGKGVRIRRDAVEVLLEPVVASTAEQRAARGAVKPFGHADSLWNIVGIAQSDGPGDVSANKHKYLADAYRLSKQ